MSGSSDTRDRNAAGQPPGAGAPGRWAPASSGPSRGHARQGPRPVVAISGCRLRVGTARFDVARSRLVSAVTRSAEALPLILPPLGRGLDVQALLASVDGLVLTGSESNVDPRFYGEAVRCPAHHDPSRDRTILPLIRPAIEAGVPLLAICRGLQELNVAFGGTLHQSVSCAPGHLDHREDESTPRYVQYAPRHRVSLTEGGMLAGLWGRTEARVNSLHGQGIRRLGRRLTVEATAPDGLVEAVGVEEAPGFVLGVQWHPEWFAADDPFSSCLFQAFGETCRQRALDRARGVRPQPSCEPPVPVPDASAEPSSASNEETK